MQGFGYAQGGLVEVQQRFLKRGWMEPRLRAPLDVVRLLENANQEVRLRYNISALISWVVEQVRALNQSIFKLTASALHIVLTLLTMMELYQLLKISVSKQAQKDKRLAELMQNLVVEARNRAREQSLKIQGKECPMISANTIQSKDILIHRGKQMINGKTLLNPYVQPELICVFNNILLNIRRSLNTAIRHNQSQLKRLKILELLLYYLFAVTFKKPILRQIIDDKQHLHRSTTFAYLLYESDGLRELTYYLDEAPLVCLQADMEFISRLSTQSQRESK